MIFGADPRTPLPPLARLRGGISKIASMAPVVAPSWLYMHNYSSLPCSMWAVGGGGRKWGGHHFLNWGNLYINVTEPDVHCHNKAFQSYIPTGSPLS